MTKLNFFSPQTSAHSLLRFFIINIAVAAVKIFLDREDSRKPFPGRSKRRTSREEIGKWINKHLGLPKRVAPGIRLHRKAEKSVHFLLRWLGTPPPKMKSIRQNHLTPISSTLLRYVFSGRVQPSERANRAWRPPRHNNFGRCGSIGGRMKGRGLPLSPLQGGGGTPLSGA